MTEDICRKAFEEWCVNQEFKFYKNPLERMGGSFRKHYKSQNVDRSWKAWKAAWNTRKGTS